MTQAYKGAGNHLFGRKRPILSGKYPVFLEPKRNTKYRDLPKPTGKAPFHLALKDILEPAEMQAIVKQKRLTFHLNGDMGGIKYGVPQELVAKGMEKSFDASADQSVNPAFLYIMGDCVYFNGEPTQYYVQFYEPYEFYPRPIFAVPGNHDGENLDTGNSLDGFVRNFCAEAPVKQPESGDTNRTAMTQPNVYWTLTTPLVNIVGLYSNVPEGGTIKDPQKSWFVNELKTLPTDVPLFVALHHPPYSADDHHSGSVHMKKFFDEAAAEAGRFPDMVLAGHVHNYQRLTEEFPDGRQVPHLVTGAGGYHNLHHVMKVDHQAMITPVVMHRDDQSSITLEAYTDDHHGFLILSVTPDAIMGHYYQVPRPQEPYSKGNQLTDHFIFDWKNHRYRTNDLTEKAPAIGVVDRGHGRARHR